MNAKELAHNIISDAKKPGEELRAKVEAVAKQLKIDFAQAESLVKQELARKAASERYRQSDAYKARLEQQKIVRQLLKSN